MDGERFHAEKLTAKKRKGHKDFVSFALLDTPACVVNASRKLKFQMNNIIRCLVFCILFVGNALITIASPPPTNSPSPILDLTEKINQFQTWIANHSDQDIMDALGKFDLNQVSQWLDSQSQIKSQVANLEQQIKLDESLLAEKRKNLNDLQSKINLIKLTPNQIAEVAKYNQSLKQDPYFTEWITERTTWFEIGKDIVLSSLFFVLGILLESARQRRKQKKSEGKKYLTRGVATTAKS